MNFNDAVLRVPMMVDTAIGEKIIIEFFSSKF